MRFPSLSRQTLDCIWYITPHSAFFTGLQFLLRMIPDFKTPKANQSSQMNVTLHRSSLISDSSKISSTARHPTLFFLSNLLLPPTLLCCPHALPPSALPPPALLPLRRKIRQPSPLQLIIGERLILTILLAIRPGAIILARLVKLASDALTPLGLLRILGVGVGLGV